MKSDILFEHEKQLIDIISREKIKVDKQIRVIHDILTNNKNTQETNKYLQKLLDLYKESKIFNKTVEKI